MQGLGLVEPLKHQPNKNRKPALVGFMVSGLGSLALNPKP